MHAPYCPRPPARQPTPPHLPPTPLSPLARLPAGRPAPPAVYPQLDTRQMEVSTSYINGCIGLNLAADEVSGRVGWYVVWFSGRIGG